MPQIHPPLSKTTYDPATSKMGPRANNNSIRSGHLRDTALAYGPCALATTYDLATSKMGSRANSNINLRSGHLRSGHLRDTALAPAAPQPMIWPPPRWALASTTTAYDLATSEIWPLRPRANLQSGHLRDGIPEQQQPTIWPPPRCGPCALTPPYDMATSKMWPLHQQQQLMI